MKITLDDSLPHRPKRQKTQKEKELECSISVLMSIYCSSTLPPHDADDTSIVRIMSFNSFK